MEMTDADRIRLINAIASREGTAKQLSKTYGYSLDELKDFVSVNIEAIELAREALLTIDEEKEDEVTDEPTPQQLDDLWITNKFERLYRYQKVCDAIARHKYWEQDNVALREYRSYLRAAAEELGQLLHRGSGDAGSGDTVSYEIDGIDLTRLQ